MPGAALAAAWLTIAGVLLSACSFGPPKEEEAGTPPKFPTPSSKAAEEDDGATLAAEPIVEGLQIPWGLDFLPDGAALVTERETRNIYRITTEFKKKKIQTIDEAYADGEGGLMGLAVSPQYDEDKTIFIYYTTREDNRIAKLKLGEEPKPIVTGIPVSGVHNGGRLAFGPDGYLYATTGDASDSGIAQDKKKLGGKILRMTKDGKPAKGNPFGNLVYSYGHRNSQGIAWDEKDQLYAVEFGQNTWDEVNLVEPGKNYGWPKVEGKGGSSRYVDPFMVWKPEDASCSGAAILGDVLVTACLRGKRTYAMQLNGKGGLIGAPQQALVDEYGRLRTVVVAPDKTLWVTTSNLDGRGDPNPGDDKIIRIVLASDGGNGKT
ncbi:MAG: PQQ-dependent sugar dehydrogenase [Micromonosporaceae bacterium]|nr:PQQ-dependent sugar dehydrogenase [Micromonosporaceae bacterium]